MNLVKEGGTEAISNMESLQTQFSQMSTAGWEEGSVGSVTGAEMTPFGPIVFRKPYLNKEYITDDEGNQIPAALVGHDKNGGSVYKYFGSPVHNFFNSDVMAKVNNNVDDTTYTNDPGWFGSIGSPHSDEGVGTMGKAHEGVVLKFGHTRNIPAITGGTVTYVTKQNRTGKSNGLGNSVKWRDSGGMYHWFMHLGSINRDIAEGSDITPGMVIGTSGNTGEGGEAFDTPVVRYVVTSAGPMGNTGDAGFINPFTYWQFEESYNHGSYSKNDYMNGSFWSQTYADKFSNSDYHNQAQKAGLTGAQEAMVAAIGIHEDAGQKLFGEKSLTRVVYDCAAHPWAFGIMNWTPDPQNAYEGATETKYGTTLAEQLPYMYKMYFASNPEHERARIISSNYSQYSGNLQTVLGHSLALKPGDAWGPLAETDIAEAMGHYVANALIPSDWYTTEGLGKRIGTAVDAYNWMVDKGWINASKQGVDGGTSINGHFVASQTNPDAFISQDGYFSSDGGAVLADYGKPSITSTNIDGNTSGNSPLHEFFTKTGGTGNAYSANENWYLKRLNPNKQGVGSQDSATGSHGGVDFNWDTGSGGKEVHATTHGVVDAVTTSGSAGNSIRWLDDAGYLHWYMHMRDQPLLAEKAEVKPGQLLGYVGNTGDSGGEHLHYSIIKADKFNGWSDSPGGVNPLMYFHNYNSAGPQTNPNERGGLSFVTGTTDTLMNNLTTYANRSTNGGLTEGEKTLLAVNEAGSMANYIQSITGNNSSSIKKVTDIWDASQYPQVGLEGRREALETLVNYYNRATDKNSSYYNKNFDSFPYSRDYWDTVTDVDKGLTVDDLNTWIIQNYVNGNPGDNVQTFLTSLKNAQPFVGPVVTTTTTKSNTSSGGSHGGAGHYRGSGDVSNSWYDALYGTNPTITTTTDIPPLDESALNDDAGLAALQQYTNKYNIRSSDANTTDMLNKLENMTFNVRAKRVEELLEILINKVDGGSSGDEPLPNMFDEEIPDAVTRLSIG